MNNPYLILAEKNAKDFERLDDDGRYTQIFLLKYKVGMAVLLVGAVVAGLHAIADAVRKI